MRRQQGFALLEVLITIVILALGMLGLASLQNRLLVYEIESYQRSQALMLLQDIADRLGTNRKNAADYADARMGGGDATADCTGLAGAALDLCEWDGLLKGTTESKGGASVGKISGAVGCIDDLGGGRFRVSVAWQGFNMTAAPAVACGQNAFGDERLRRVVTDVVRMANLSCDPDTPGTC